MSRPKGAHDIAPMIRASLIRAATRLGNGDGIGYLATQMESHLQSDFLATINAISKFTIKEKEVTGKIDHDHRHTHVAVSESLGWIAGLVEVEPGPGARALTKPVQN